MVRYICFGHIISDGSISNSAEKVCFNHLPGPVPRGQYIGPAHGPELSIFTSLCTATEESFAWARPRVNLLCSNFHCLIECIFGLTSESSIPGTVLHVGEHLAKTASLA